MKNILKKQIFSAFLGTLFCISVLLYVPCKINVVSATTSRDLWADDGTIQFIQKLEGFDPQCFYDNGQWTYGYGSKCTSSNHPVLTDEQKAQSAKKKYYGGHYITKEDALVLLKDKLNGYYRNVLIQYTDGLEMNQYQFDALLSATYNHGNVRADGCKACGYIPMPLVKYLQGEYSEEQARQEYPNWMAVFSGYNLTSRRMAELERFFMGTPPAPKPWYSSMTQVDVGTDFFAYIINVEPWKHLTNDNGNVVMTSETGAANQIWRFMRNDDGSYRIINCADSTSMDVCDISGDSGANVQTWAQNDSAAQKWYIYGESGKYYFRAACTDCALDINGGVSDDGANVQMYNKNDTTAQIFQIWKLEPKFSVEPGNKINFTKFSWDNFPGDDRVFDVKIWKGKLWEGDAYHVEWSIKGTSWEAELPPGHYEAYVEIRFDKERHMSNVVTFDVEEEYFGQSELSSEPGDKSKKTHFSWTKVDKAERYTLKIWKDKLWEGDAYFMERITGTEMEVDLPVGYYEAYVDAASDTLDVYQMSNVVKITIKENYIEPVIIGDCNNDGKLSAIDAIALRKYLLGVKDAELANSEAADLDDNGVINIVDFIMLKSVLI